MSPVQVAPPRRVETRAAPEPAGAPAAFHAPPRDSVLVRLATFAALAAFGAGHWAGLVVQPQAGRTAGVVAIAVAGAAALAALPRLRLRGPLLAALAALTALGTLAVGLAAAGLEARLLLPGGWAELLDGLDRGLSGLHTADWPYRGSDPWVRLTILLGAPSLLAAAAALAFWPARRLAPGLRAAGLVVLLLLYGVGVTEHDPGAPLLRGLVLLALVAAWLWLPRLSPREVAAGAGLVVAVGVCSLPLAAALDGDRPWWDYRSWSWFAGGEDITFDWTHSYGPLDWSREGTTLLHVKSARPHYWKTQVLDRFDGVRWVRSSRADSIVTGVELPERLGVPGRRWRYFRYNPAWESSARVTVRSLTSDLIVSAGNTLFVKGAGTTRIAGDGTTSMVGEPLEEGDSYTVRFYAPDPSAAQMRGAPATPSPDRARYTAIELPRGRGIAERSPYAPVYELARRLTAGAPSTYDAVKRVERHLQRSYEYGERPPTRAHPLAAFLLRDRIGYCQQFSGAMALMLRMAGIPTRVASGFASGSLHRDTGEYRVRDLDAHSWVEVHFPGIGWVPFDPTPAAAPALSRSDEAGPTNATPDEAGQVRGGQGAGEGAARASEDVPAPGEAGGRPLEPWMVLPALLVLALASVMLAALRAAVRSRKGAAGDPAEAQLRELEQALRRLGWALPGGTTLLTLERLLRRGAGPAAGDYAAALRAHRYDPRLPGPPGPAARRALRRELAAAAGLRGRVRAVLSLPPRGPRF